jgi:hypothetical protein
MAVKCVKALAIVLISVLAYGGPASPCREPGKLGRRKLAVASWGHHLAREESPNRQDKTILLLGVRSVRSPRQLWSLSVGGERNFMPGVVRPIAPSLLKLLFLNPTIP